MEPLELAACHALRSVQGWIELGQTAEARRELEALPADWLAHPDVWSVQWQLLAAEERWTEALEMASRLVRVAPRDPTSWIHRSYCLHELNRTHEALEELLPATNLFPKVDTIFYNLACYTCQLGMFVDAQGWLKRAYAAGNKSDLMRMALADKDLKPLWATIRKSDSRRRSPGSTSEGS